MQSRIISSAWRKIVHTVKGDFNMSLVAHMTTDQATSSSYTNHSHGGGCRRAFCMSQDPYCGGLYTIYRTMPVANIPGLLHRRSRVITLIETQTTTTNLDHRALIQRGFPALPRKFTPDFHARKVDRLLATHIKRLL
jgi:hypothetical protein